MKWFKHAFAVDPPGEHEPLPEQQEVVDWVCKQIARRRLTTPGLIFLEMGRPLNFLASQMMRFFDPILSAVLREKGFGHYKHFAQFLEHRGSVDYLCRRIEHFEQEYDEKDKNKAAQRKKAAKSEEKSDKVD